MWQSVSWRILNRPDSLIVNSAFRAARPLGMGAMAARARPARPAASRPAPRAAAPPMNARRVIWVFTLSSGCFAMPMPFESGYQGAVRPALLYPERKSGARAVKRLWLRMQDQGNRDARGVTVCGRKRAKCCGVCTRRGAEARNTCARANRRGHTPAARAASGSPRAARTEL